MQISTTVHGGKIPDKYRKQIKDFLESNEGKLIHISLTRVYKPKSVLQRGYYWGVMLSTIFNGTQGTEFEYGGLMEIHEEMKIQFLTVVPMKPDGTMMSEKVLSTEDLNTRETEEYHEQIRRFWAFRGLSIPEPNEVDQVYLDLV
jgi:hypothetical protein